MQNSVEVTLATLEEAFSRCLYTSDFRLALWSALVGDSYDIEVRRAATEINVSKVRRFTEMTDGKRHGLLFDTSDGQRWQMTIGTVLQ